jgi:hypothetical protein
VKAKAIITSHWRDGTIRVQLSWGANSNEYVFDTYPPELLEAIRAGKIDLRGRQAVDATAERLEELLKACGVDAGHYTLT